MKNLPFALEEVSIHRLETALRSGEVTSVDLVEAYLDRIAKIDSKKEVGLNSVSQINPDALATAQNRDSERKNGQAHSPLHGIPVLLKENIGTEDRMETTAGSLALLGAKVARDAHIVTKLRDAGAILLGKTNLSEWANFRSTRSISGWSGRGGQTHNPYALDRNTSGSSSGSGAAVSANLCTVAVGTETDGSVVSPSSVCGIVGIKPTMGLVSRSGIVPLSHTQDTAGPMARSVVDAVTLLNVLAGYDSRDSATQVLRGRPVLDYRVYLVPGSLKGARLGVPRALFPNHPAIKHLFNEIVGLLRKQGAVVIDNVAMPTNGKFDDAELEVLLYDFKHDLNLYLAGLKSSPVRTLRDVIRFNERNVAKEMPYFGQETLIMAQEKGDLTTPAYRKALELCKRMSQREGIDAAMKKHGLDALIAPTNGPAWPIDIVNSDHYTGGNSTFAAVAGYPHITVPMGAVFGLPFGLSFIGSAFHEPTLIKLAYSFEQVTSARQVPKFLPTVKG